MSDDLKDDFPGATKGLFASVGLMLLFVGGDMMADKEGLRLGLGLFLVLLGCGFFYASFFWQTAKTVLSDEAQIAVTNFAKSRNTWLAVIFLLFQTLVLSRFVEQHRWPFSYPIDDSVINENTELKRNQNDLANRLTTANDLATKWRFIHELRYFVGDAGACHYYVNPTTKTKTAARRWHEQLNDADWNGSVTSGAQDGTMPLGITLRVPDATGLAHVCGSALQKAMSDIYPIPEAKLIVTQTNCGQCVQIDMDY